MPMRRRAPTKRSAFLALGTLSCMTMTLTSAAADQVEIEKSCLAGAGEGGGDVAGDGGRAASAHGGDDVDDLGLLAHAIGAGDALDGGGEFFHLNRERNEFLHAQVHGFHEHV